MNLTQAKLDYKNGVINKQDYINDMHDFHRILFEYATFIKDTDISSIEISDDSVIMTSRSGGIKMLCDKSDKRIIPIEILNFGHFERQDFDMMLRLIKDGMTIFDIGANIGWYSLNVSKAINGVKLLAFEPIPKTFAYLKKNLQLNNIQNVQVYNFGFSSEEKDLTFYYCPDCSGNTSLADLSGSDSVEKIVCHVQKLDDFVSASNVTIDFIKCDVEGAELFVFHGGMEIIKRCRPIIFAELLRKWASKFNYHPNEVIQLLKGVGYRCFTADHGKLKEFFTMDEQTSETNFYFLHTEKHNSKIKQLT